VAGPLGWGRGKRGCWAGLRSKTKKGAIGLARAGERKEGRERWWAGWAAGKEKRGGRKGRNWVGPKEKEGEKRKINQKHLNLNLKFKFK
jgi:hypothetical protein